MERTKAEWRRDLLAARTAIPEGERRQRSLAMVGHVRGLSCFRIARSVLGYLPIGAEADASPLLAADSIPGRAHFVPAGEHPEDTLRWAAWPGGEAIRERIGAGGLDYPVIAIVPGVGFDERGVRLGRGRGFYDRALAELRDSGATIAIGLAFRCQIVPRLPRDPWDQHVDFIVSEDGVITAEYSKQRMAAEPHH